MAPTRSNRETITLLGKTFGDRIISRNRTVNWSPQWCGLTPLDYFLCGYIKSLIYVCKPVRIDHLEANIIDEIRPGMLEKTTFWASH